MSNYTAISATSPFYDLAEGILWDDSAAVVRRVNIRKGRVHSGALGGQIRATGTVDCGQITGAVALAKDGGLPIAEARGLATVSPEGAVSFGPELNTLGSTAAQEGLTEFSDQSGAIFVAEVGVTSLPSHRWAGSTTTPYWQQKKEEHA